MASYLQIENISKSYGSKVLFQNIAFNINEGDKISLIAPNGAGKTSLLRILAGKDSSDSGGKIIFLKDIRIAFLEQDYSVLPDETLFNQVLLHSKAQTEHFSPEQKEHFKQKLREHLTNFRLKDFNERKMKELSGGEVKRVAISEMLSLEADFLIMDEPSNHLDIEAIEYLENYLQRSRCTLLMVTHDRYLLDRVCNIVMELDHGAIYAYRGDYQNYLEKREARIAAYDSETDKVRNILRRELEWIHATPCARSGKAKYRIDAFHELEERAGREYKNESISLSSLGETSHLGGKIIDCHHVSYSWNGEYMIKDFNYNFQRGDKVGITGRNGIGKSTFLDLLTGAILPNQGTIERGESVVIGYYRQEGMHFDEDLTVLETVNDTSLLGQFLFPHEMYSTRVTRLSGGEKRRLYLLSILMRNPNLLILDEPTNDLDIVTLNILEEFLAGYKGSLIVVSHDRHFLDRVAEHLLVFCGNGKIKDFVGHFSEYRAFIKDLEAAARKDSSAVGSSSSPSSSAKSVAKPAAKREKPNKLSYKEQKEIENIEKSIGELNGEKTSLEEKINSGTLPYKELQTASERIGEILSEIEKLENRWLELQEKI